MAQQPATKVTVSRLTDEEFQVEVSDAEGKTQHTVHIDAAAVEKFGYGHPAETLVATSFRFLLEREPKVSILGSFDLSIVEKFFPEYSTEMKSRLNTDSPG